MMNKEEIKFDHFKDIEDLVQHLEMWYAEDDYYAYDRYFHLRDASIMGMYIYDLQKRIDKAIQIMYDKATFNLNDKYGKVFLELLEILGGKE